MRKYRTWAFLNSEGKAVWGDIFPEGEIPIQSILVQLANLEGIDQVERVLLVDWKELTEQQQNAVLEKLSKRTGASKIIIQKDITKVGLPLREKYVDYCATNRLGLFA